MNILISGVRLVDAHQDFQGSVLIEGGRIQALFPQSEGVPKPEGQCSSLGRGEGVTAAESPRPTIHIDGHALGSDVVCMPAFVDLHAHFRDPGFPLKETLESGSLAAAAGGYGTVVCMANTQPVIDSVELARHLQGRANALGLIDLFPVLSLSQGMDGRSVAHLAELDPVIVRLLSEDGKDLADEGVLRAALQEARRRGIRVSHHCDFGGKEAEQLKAQGAPREIYSRLEENHGTERVLRLAHETGCAIHIAHVSTQEALKLVQEYRQRRSAGQVTCEVTPHHLALTEERARELGTESYGRVNPPLRTEVDREALIAGIQEGLVDAIATDHAPHTAEDKARGAPGFIGLETAFPVCYTVLVKQGSLHLSTLSALMSYNPARILGLPDRGLLQPGLQADLVLIDLGKKETIGERPFVSRSRNSPFAGFSLEGSILLTIHRGKIVYQRGS